MPDLGLGLRRTDERSAAVAALLAERSLERVGLDTLFQDAPRKGRRGLAWARSVRSTHTFDRADRRDVRWWPQGVAWPDVDEPSTAGLGDRRVVAMTWYAKAMGADPRGGHGCRITFYDVASHRYEHALVVVPTIDDQGVARAAPLRVHAGGLAWSRGHLHVAATAKGFHTVRLDDLLQVRSGSTPPARVHTAGHRYLLPVHHSWQPETAKGTEPLRYSFLSLDRSAGAHGGPSLLVGEYGRGQQTKRLAWFPLDEATGLPARGRSGATAAERVAVGVRNMQGAVVLDGHVLVTASRGPRTPGSLLQADLGGAVATLGKDAFTERRWATPMGPEDLTLDPSGRGAWTVTEHPHRRWLVELRTP